MSKTIDLKYNPPAIQSVFLGEPIVETPLKQVLSQNHRQFAISGNCLGGLVFKPAWTLGSGNVTDFNENYTGTHQPRDWCAVFPVMRPAGDGANECIIQVSMYAARMRLSWGVRSVAGTNSDYSNGFRGLDLVRTLTNDTPTMQWVTDTFSLNIAGGTFPLRDPIVQSELQLFQLRVKCSSTPGQTGILQAFHAHSAHLTNPGDMP